MKALSAIHDLAQRHKPALGGLEILKYIGPGLLVTVGFIDPGNWASNVAAGADYGYSLLWIVTLSTLMLIVIQHNVAHLGIVTGLCLSEAATLYTPYWASRSILGSAVLASISTSLAEILGAAIALNMLFRVPVWVGATLSVIFVGVLLFTNTYPKIERWVIAFVSLIGLSFIYELTLVNIAWKEAVTGWTVPSIPQGSMIVVMSVMGAVVMPHNLFLHSEIIQSRQWNLGDDKVIKRQLDYEMFDTLFSMVVGWAINSAMILLAASVFFNHGVHVTELQQAGNLLGPLLGNNAPNIFAVALLCSGIASSITSGMAGGSIFAGLYGEPYNIKDSHSRLGVLISLVLALALIFLVGDPFKGLIYSQVCLSMQLPITVFLQIYLTSSKRVMGKYVNSELTLFTLLAMGMAITYLNVRLLVEILW
jgi:manganese transport protein